jgi:hypothetical protein
MPTVGPAFDPGPAGAPVEPLPMRPTPPVVGLEPSCEGGMLPPVPAAWAAPAPLAEFPPADGLAPELGQSARDARRSPPLPLPVPVRSGGQLVVAPAPLAPLALLSPLAPLAPLALPVPPAPPDVEPDPESAAPVRPASTELPEPRVPALVPELLLVGVWALASELNASVNAANNAEVPGFMVPPSCVQKRCWKSARESARSMPLCSHARRSTAGCSGLQTGSAASSRGRMGRTGSPPGRAPGSSFVRSAKDYRASPFAMKRLQGREGRQGWGKDEKSRHASSEARRDLVGEWVVRRN